LNQKDTLHFLVVGAGIAGLTFAKSLHSQHSVTLFEKSPGLGGRVATRRHGAGAWDHGIPYLLKNEIPDFLWELWAPALKPIGSSLSCFSSPLGLTEIAKRMSVGLEIKRNCRVSKVIFLNSELRWKLIDEAQQEFVGDVLVLATPIPQTLELLKTSSPDLLDSLNANLEKLIYRPQLVLLGTAPSFPGADWEVISPIEPFEKFVNNGAKGIRNSQGFFTGYLSESFSQKYFEEGPEKILSLLKPILESQMGVRPSHLELKKWRYSQCTHPLMTPFATGKAPYASLFCIGDGFSGGGFKGAIQSALALSRTCI